MEKHLDEFFERRLFGPHRRALLEADLGEQLRSEAAAALTNNTAKILKKEILQLQKRQHRLIEELESFDDDASAEDLRELRSGIQRRFTDLGKQIAAKRAELEDLPPVPETSAQDDLDLIDELCTFAKKLSSVPEALQRALVDAYNLQVRYHQPTRKLTIRVHVTQTLSGIREATAAAEERGTRA